MYAEITVQNDGEAISDEDKKHIFTRFTAAADKPARQHRHRTFARGSNCAS